MEEYEVRRRYRELELTDSHSGLQIILFDETAALTIPFGKHLEKTLSFAWDCLNVLEVEGHFAVYDSQVGKILNLKADFDVVKKALTE